MDPAVLEDPCFHILDDGDQDPEVAEGGPTRSFPVSWSHRRWNYLLLIS